jgi:hypothetical protein
MSTLGLIANLNTRKELPADGAAKFIARGGSVYMNRPVFPGGLTGGRQLGLRAAPSMSEADSPSGFIDAALPGGVAFVDPYAFNVSNPNSPSAANADIEVGGAFWHAEAGPDIAHGKAMSP